MACGSCGRRATRTPYVTRSLTDPTPKLEPEHMSAASLTPEGWTRTCVKCGARSEPMPFPSQIKVPCEC